MSLKRCLTAAVVVVALRGTTVMAGIAGTKHDFSGEGWAQGQVCLPCHIPHHSNTDIGYLWNHAVPDDADFTKYPGATLGPESLVCLGCHDGVTAIDSFGGVDGSIVITGSANVGTNLLDDHPVGIDYPTGGRGYHSAADAKAAGVTLYGSTDKVECASCHTPHDDTNGGFLRMPNSWSGLCLACHDI